MDLDFIIPAAVAVNTLISCGTAVYALLTASSKKTATDLAEFKATVATDFETIQTSHAAVDRRVQTLESELKHLPDRAMVHDLQLTLKDIQIELASVKAATEQATRTSQRVETYLLERSKEGGK